MDLTTLFDLYRRYRTPRRSARERRADERRVELWTRVLGAESDPAEISLRDWEACPPGSDVDLCVVLAEDSRPPRERTPDYLPDRFPTGRGPSPESYRATFELAGGEGLLAEELADRLSRAAGLRNILVHLYEDIDYEIVAASIDGALDDFWALLRTLEAELPDAGRSPRTLPSPLHGLSPDIRYRDVRARRRGGLGAPGTRGLRST